MSTFRLHDEVLQRFVQIFQEALLLGVDCSDIMRQVRVCAVEDDVLVLTDEYRNLVKEHHQKLVEEAEMLAAQDRAYEENQVF
jgi:hypothetical protein